MGITYTGGTRPLPFIAQATYQYVSKPENWVFPWFSMVVPQEQGTLPQVTRESLMGDGITTRRGPGASFNRSDHTVDGVAYTCLGYGHEHKVPEEQRAYWGSYYNALQAGAIQVREKIQVDLESRLATLLFNTSTWTGSALYTDNSGSPWDNVATIIINQVIDAKEKVRAGTGMDANAIIMSQVQLNNCLKNTDIKNRLTYVQVATPAAIRQSLAQMFELDYVIVGKSVYNAGKEGAAISVTDIWSDDYAMVCRIDPTGNLNEHCVARVPWWSAMGNGTDMKLETYYENQTKSDIVQGSAYIDEVVVDAAMGHLIKIDA